MQQIDVERSQEFRKCIECFLCQNVCHVIRDHEGNKRKFAGPRFLIRVAELELNPLDVGDRIPLAHEEMGLAYCNITKCCTDVCPEHIQITDNAHHTDEGARGRPATTRWPGWGAKSRGAPRKRQKRPPPAELTGHNACYHRRFMCRSAR